MAIGATHRWRGCAHAGPGSVAMPSRPPWPASPACPLQLSQADGRCERPSLPDVLGRSWLRTAGRLRALSSEGRDRDRGGCYSIIGSVPSNRPYPILTTGVSNRQAASSGSKSLPALGLRAHRPGLTPAFACAVIRRKREDESAGGLLYDTSYNRISGRPDGSGLGVMNDPCRGSGPLWRASRRVERGGAFKGERESCKLC